MADIPVPAAVVTLMVPVVAPLGTVALMEVAEVRVTAVAATPLNVTEVALPRLVPVSVTTVPTTPEVGVKLVIVGGPITVKLLALVAVPPSVVTVTLPVVAPAGIVAVICVAETTVKATPATPLNATALAFVRFVPVRVTTAPTIPEVGASAVTVGAGTVTV